LGRERGVEGLPEFGIERQCQRGDPAAFGVNAWVGKQFHGILGRANDGSGAHGGEVHPVKRCVVWPDVDPVDVKAVSLTPLS